MNFTTFGGRRFVLAVGSGIVSSVLVWFGKITPEVFGNVIMWTVAAYIAGGTIDNKLGGKPKE